MADATTRNPEGKIGQSAVMDLRKALRGPLLQPFDPGYDEARSIWNGMITRQPALIARVTGMADVITCVNFARDNGLTAHPTFASTSKSSCTAGAVHTWHTSADFCDATIPAAPWGQADMPPHSTTSSARASNAGGLSGQPAIDASAAILVPAVTDPMLTHLVQQADLLEG
jgi:hypothetical protein